MSTSNIFMSFSVLVTACRTEFPARKSEGVNGLYNALLHMIEKQGVLCIPRTQSHSFEIIKPKPGEVKGLTTVRAEFDFVAADGSILTAGAVGVHCSEELALTTKLVTLAQRQALLGVFLLPAAGRAPVAENVTETPTDPTHTSKAQQVVAETNKVKGGVVRTTTADQLPPGPSPEQRAAATKAMNEWRAGIPKLDSKKPGQWDQHLVKIGTLPMLLEHNRAELLDDLVQAAYAQYVDYDPTTQKFKLSPEVPVDATA